MLGFYIPKATAMQGNKQFFVNERMKKKLKLQSEIHKNVNKQMVA